MKYLQIWLGKSPNSSILQCMQSVRDKLTDNDEYILISNGNFLNDENITWIDSNKYIKELRNDVDIDLVWKKIPSGNTGYCYKSDIIRLDYLSKNDNVLYLDCDVILLDVLKFSNDIIYLSKYNRMFDCYLMYGDKRYFKEVLYFCVKYVKPLTFFPHSWIFRIINCKKLTDKYTCAFIENKYKHKDY